MADMCSKSNFNGSFAICYGLAGGPLHTRKFRKLMRQTGYAQARDLMSADIIIAHSAGCWLIPADAKPRLVLYVGMPLNQANPRRVWTHSSINSLRGGLARSLAVKLRNGYYYLRQPVRNLRIMCIAKTATPVVFTEAACLFIMNRHDVWPRSPALKEYVEAGIWNFISTPGGHEDIWEHPEAYVAIIGHYARLLAQADTG